MKMVTIIIKTDAYPHVTQGYTYAVSAVNTCHNLVITNTCVVHVVTGTRCFDLGLCMA